MILGRSGNIPFVEMMFSFGREVQLVHSRAILDTGASYTLVPLGVLTGYDVSKHVIDEEIERLKLLFAKDISYAQSSSGVGVPTLRTYITNIAVRSDCGTFNLERLDIRLALISNFQFALLGYDFIMSHIVVNNYNYRLYLDQFDKVHYDGINKVGNLVDIDDIMSFISI